MTNNQMDKINRKAYFEIRDSKGAVIKEITNYKKAIKEFENLNSTIACVLWDNVSNRRIW